MLLLLLFVLKRTVVREALPCLFAILFALLPFENVDFISLHMLLQGRITNVSYKNVYIISVSEVIYPAKKSADLGEIIEASKYPCTGGHTPKVLCTHTELRIQSKSSPPNCESY